MLFFNREKQLTNLYYKYKRNKSMTDSNLQLPINFRHIQNIAGLNMPLVFWRVYVCVNIILSLTSCLKFVYMPSFFRPDFFQQLDCRLKSVLLHLISVYTILISGVCQPRCRWTTKGHTCVFRLL